MQGVQTQYRYTKDALLLLLLLDLLFLVFLLVLAQLLVLLPLLLLLLLLTSCADELQQWVVCLAASSLFYGDSFCCKGRK